MSVIDKIQRRRCYPVEIDGGTIHVRPLGYWDKVSLDSLTDAADQIAYAMGVCLVEEDGSRVFTRGKDESAAEFAARIRNVTDELNAESIVSISAAISKVTKTPQVETVVKNSEATTTPEA